MSDSTIALLGVMIPVVIVLLISAVPIYFRLSERRRGKALLDKEPGEPDIVDEVERLRRQQSD